VSQYIYSDLPQSKYKIVEYFGELEYKMFELYASHSISKNVGDSSFIKLKYNDRFESLSVGEFKGFSIAPGLTSEIAHKDIKDEVRYTVPSYNYLTIFPHISVEQLKIGVNYRATDIKNSDCFGGTSKACGSSIGFKAKFDF